MDRITVFLVALALGLVVGSIAKGAPVEQRCTELAAACICSEPLRYTSGGTVTNGDPADSEGAGAKECGPSGVALDLEPNPTTLVSSVDNGSSGVDFPGPNPPAFVLSMTSTTNDGDNGWLLLGDSLTNVANETVCVRSYHRWANNLQYPTNNRRIKSEEAAVNGAAVQTEVAPSGRLGINYGCSDEGSLDLITNGKQSWLRWEVCYDVTPGQLTRRARVTVVDTGVSDGVECSESISTPANLANIQIANWFLQTFGQAGNIGTRYATHATQARVPLNTAFWIGAAYELEGGGDTDGDAVSDSLDNCTNVANMAQQDYESDGCGNACDGDFDDNGISNIADLNIFKATYGLSEGQPGYDDRADMDDNNTVNVVDNNLFKAEYLTPPGPGANCPH